MSQPLFWNPEDIKSEDPIVIIHKLNVDPTIKPVKQKKRKFTLKL